MTSLKYKTAGHKSSLSQVFFYILKLKKKNNFTARTLVSNPTP